MTRAAESEEATERARIQVELDLDGSGDADIQCDAPLVRDLLRLWCRAAGFDLTLRGGGALDHHAMEAAALAIGRAWRLAYGPTIGTRVAYDVAPRSDALVLVAVDLADRPNYVGDVPVPLWEHFLRTFATEARIDLHVGCMRGRTPEHTLEAAFTAFGLALRRAMGPRTSSPKAAPAAEREGEAVVPRRRKASRDGLQKANAEVHAKVGKRELPEVAAAKERDRRLHARTPRRPDQGHV